MADPSRRTSSPAPIPKPPPLPNLPSNSRSYFSRFVNSAYGSRPPSAQASRPDHNGRRNPLVPLPGLRTGSSQDASHKTGLEISALDINRDRTHAILAGKEILKTVCVQDARIVEETNLRAAVIHYADRSHARQREGLGIQDVKWSHGQFNTHIATAAANGKVILYDLNRAGVELARLHEHNRQVHKLAFNPHLGHLLLSASQDATVRMWDLRDMRKDITTCRSRDQYQAINGAIYDVQWSPTDGVEFALGTENGTIQRWDFRYHKSPKQKITAHDTKPCTSIDWHPDGKHLLSAGADRTVKIWDFSVDGRRQKPQLVLTTPYPVHRARWRPPCWSDEHHERGAYQCNQLATSYDRDHSMIHVWDLRRPYLPSREINKFASASSDMLWHSRDTLWTVGREGVFQQNDIHRAPKTIDRRNLQAIAISPSGELGAFAQVRARNRRSTRSVYSDDTYLGHSHDKRSSPEKTSFRGSAEDSADDSFLSSSLKKHHGRTASNRSAKSFSSTPPSDTVPKVMFLTDSMAIPNESHRLNQLAIRGTLPGAPNVHVLAYLAQKYRSIALPDPPTVQSYQDVHRVFEQNAEYAQRAACHRLAQTWRIIGASIAVATRRRAKLHRQRRLQTHQHSALAPSDMQPYTPSRPSNLHDKQSPVHLNPASRPLLEVNGKPSFVESSVKLTATTNITPAESTSNIATPLARPLTTPVSSIIDTQKHALPDPDHGEAIELPPAVTGPSSEMTMPIAGDTDSSSNLERPDFKGPQWYRSSNDLDERRAMVGSWRAPPRIPLQLGPTDAQGINIQIPPRLDRHDSDESFAMFSASTDSLRGNSMPNSFESGNSQSRGMESIPEKWQYDFEGSSFGNLTRLQTDGADKGVEISPTTIPLGDHAPASAAVPSQSGQQGPGRDETAVMDESINREKAAQDMKNLTRNNQLLRHDSSESSAYTSSGDHLSSTSSLLEHSYDLEASGTIVPEGHEDTKSPQAIKPLATLHCASESAPPVLDPRAEEPLLVSDFQAMHVDAEKGSPFSVIGFLQDTLAFHTDTLADAQTSSLLLLLLAPLLPQTHSPLNTSEINETEVQSTVADTLAAIGLSPTQVNTILATQLTQLLATGINPYQAESILHTYHAQLHSSKLYNAAASLRRLAYPTYPGVYEQALKETQVGLLCLNCKSPINNPKDKMRCESCKRAQAPCPICWGRYPAFEPITAKKKAKVKYRSTLKSGEHSMRRSSSPASNNFVVNNCDDTPSPTMPEAPATAKATLWTWCALCGHGGHTFCLSTWFTDSVMSEGACPTEGCLCDCVQGKRRDDKMKALLALKEEKERSKLVRKGDDWKVIESKAVSAVRGAIGDAAPTVRKEDGKRVRVVEPHDGQVQQQHAPVSQFVPHTAAILGRPPKG
ncbi:hypothetical protein DM02DRAFT_114404 [Periconia macrospinosa]|uniref:Uncharacterized protein n=1 Tax=Periconia macrospinosa TaxID=97972 RepID=A0A2V1E5C8_9PLEO|nr:hypothetical protein DM02DRAFT_114404 [Periconia macrospinosa]